jgi:hypothetical protein
VTQNINGNEAVPEAKAAQIEQVVRDAKMLRSVMDKKKVSTRPRRSRAIHTSIGSRKEMYE